jgi:hypothetical protein
MLRPLDPPDPRPADRVGGWLVKARTLAEERARALVEEHEEPFPGSGLD